MSYQNNKITYHTETVSSILLENSKTESAKTKNCQTQELVLANSVSKEQHKGNQNVIEDDDVEFLHPSTKQRLELLEKIDVDELLDRFRKQIHPAANDVTTRTYLTADEILKMHREENASFKTPEMLAAEQISKLYTG